jgi:hypothetical protein
MRIYIVETAITGHHLSYLKLFIRGFSELKYDLTVISPATIEDLKDGDLELANVDIHKLDSKLVDFHGGGIFSYRGHLKNTWLFLRDVVKKSIESSGNQPDLVFFPMVDSYIGPYVLKQEIDYLFPYNWSGLYMKPQSTILKPSFSYLRRLFLNHNHIFNSKYCKSVGIFIETTSIELLKVINKPIIVFPDIVDMAEINISSTLIKSILKKANGRKIITLSGSLDKRKGVMNFVEIANKLSNENLFFVLAGEISESSFSIDEINFIKNGAQNNSFFFLKRIIDENTFNGLISISSLIYAVYINFPFSSNLIGKAALYNKPILVASNTYMGFIVDKYLLGRSVIESDINSIIKEVLYMSTDDYLFSFDEMNLTNQYIEDNNFDQFLIRLKELLSSVFCNSKFES